MQEGPADKCLALKSTVSVFQQPLIFVITDVVLDCLPISDRRIIFNLVERTLLEATLLWMTLAKGRENERTHLDRRKSCLVMLLEELYVDPYKAIILASIIAKYWPRYTCQLKLGLVLKHGTRMVGCVGRRMLAKLHIQEQVYRIGHVFNH